MFDLPEDKFDHIDVPEIGMYDVSVRELWPGAWRLWTSNYVAEVSVLRPSIEDALNG